MMGKIHRDILVQIGRMKIPLDDIKCSLKEKAKDKPEVVYQVLDELKSLGEAISYKVKDLETAFNL